MSSPHPTVKLRHLAQFNPPVPEAVTSDPVAEWPLLPMEDIGNFTPPTITQHRTYEALSTGYSYLEPSDIAYAKVTPCFENGKGLDGADLEGPTFATTEVSVLRPQPDVSQRFLTYVLQSEGFRSAAIASMTGAGGLRRVSESSMKNYRTPAPDVSVQNKIADYLDHETAEIDHLIKDLHLFLDISHARMKATVESLLRGEQFTRIKLRRLSPMRRTGTSVNADSEPAHPGAPGILKTGAVSKGWFDPSENKAVTDPREASRLTAPLTGDRVLVNRANTPDLVGSAVYIANDAQNLFLSDKLWSIDFKAVNSYIALALSTRAYREQISMLSVGASSSMQNLSYSDFLGIQVPVPDERTQKEIVAHVDSLMSRELEVEAQAKNAIDLARERRAALITAAVTGQIDVTARNRPAAEQLEDDIAQGLHRKN
ncbi:restriction endonuclease subunit S [Kocuria sp.]|uniref:restriction endonuclease subunit S n=1 Tax=Kocuria sp. TaxID=1871328 RepID=UPI0026DA9685|nr:restriction endonuclease subunit S [Kocuria sp.]MDO4918351.1 restriction endonuclease subunit S [Kocuria sp.]